ncbi:hypothetical protein [Oceanicella sp. SM1341]|uniref:hypothetical protein n=1 Tax=Oceanicella sp. SM1341 TaxID=1548889 RepID=UPI000E4B3500|nr:hypothetical protein [Oceanicella sp. SM1341]
MTIQTPGISHAALTRTGQRRRAISEDFRRRFTPEDRQELLETLCMEDGAETAWAEDGCTIVILGASATANSLDEAIRAWCEQVRPDPALSQGA